MKIKMLGEFILVRSLKQKIEKVGDIVMPTQLTLQNLVMYGQVTELGKKKNKNGDILPYDVAIGDYVILDPKYGMQKFVKDGIVYYVMKEDAILTTIDPEDMVLVDVRDK